MEQSNMDKKLASAPEITGEEAKKALETCIGQIRRNLPEFTDKFPGASSVGNFYRRTENDDWTNGFWTGELWLACEAGGGACFKEAAVWQVRDFYRRICERVVVDHHDMGFLYTPSCTAAYRLLTEKGEEADRETAKRAAVMAADNLLGRFQEKGQFFQAWGKLGEASEYRLIIDCLLNMPLLFWASEVTGNPVYAKKAASHIETAMKYVVKPDFSTYHTYYFDPETGLAKGGATKQGYRDGSIWARGQAWGIYGSALSYKRLGNPEYLTAFEGMADCFFEHLPADLIPYWDFDFGDGSGEPRDSSSAAAAACGLLEMAGCLKDGERAARYVKGAKCLLKALTDECLVTDSSVSNGILLHGTYAKWSEYNRVTEAGVDECCLWGDYFYMEALTRVLTDWKPFW